MYTLLIICTIVILAIVIWYKEHMVKVKSKQINNLQNVTTIKTKLEQHDSMEHFSSLQGAESHGAATMKKQVLETIEKFDTRGYCGDADDAIRKLTKKIEGL